MSWSTAFLATLALEVPVYGATLGRDFARGRELVGLTLAANLLTHPALWAWATRAWPGLPTLAAAELFVALLEGLVFAAYLARWSASPPGPAFALAAALSANAFSWGAGWLWLAR